MSIAIFKVHLIRQNAGGSRSSLPADVSSAGNSAAGMRPTVTNTLEHIESKHAVTIRPGVLAVEVGRH
jgi:hypothetical protein